MYGFTQRAIHELVLLNQRFPLEGLRHDPSLIVIFGARQIDELDVGVGQSRKQQPSNAFWSHPSLARKLVTQAGWLVNARG